MLNEAVISRGIIESWSRKITDSLELDVAIVGGGPSGLVAGYYLAKGGFKVALFESKLSVGGGVWGGGMMFNEIVVQEAGLSVLSEFGLQARPWDGEHYLLDSVDVTSTLIHKAVRAGLRVFNLVSMEDVILKQGRVRGLVLNWSAVRKLGLHVDPLAVHARCVLDGTGHPAEVVSVLARKPGIALDTPTGTVVGEGPMDAERGEADTVANTGRVFPGLYASGMAANAVRGGYRMGPVFGGMLLSGKKAAELIAAELGAPAYAAGVRP